MLGPAGRAAFHVTEARREDLIPASEAPAVAHPQNSCSLLLPRWPGGRVVPLQRGDDDPPLRQVLIARTSLEQLVDTRGDPQRQPTVIRRALAGPKAGWRPAALPLLRGRHRRMLARSRRDIRRQQLFVDVRYSDPIGCVWR